MRVNKFVAQATGISRRAADTAIKNGRVKIGPQVAQLGDEVIEADSVSLDGKVIGIRSITTIILNKPVGYVCSREGQGAKTIYDLLPQQYHALKPVGRLDKDSSGLLILTNDGELANQLTHPRYSKTKIYEVVLDKPLQPLHQQMINDHGVILQDGNSKLGLQKMESDKSWQVTMSEGRNRQIRRTFDSLGYSVTKLHRTSLGNYRLDDLPNGKICIQD